jgi:hypothetical protein
MKVRNYPLTVLILALFLGVVSQPSVAHAYTTLQYASAVATTNYQHLTSPVGTHVGGKAWGYSTVLNNAIRTSTSDTYTVLHSAIGAGGASATLVHTTIPRPSTVSRCYWYHPGGTITGHLAMDCWRYRA